MKTAVVIALVVATGAAQAQAATVMRIGATGTDYASVSSTKTVSGKTIGRSTVFRMTVSGSAQVEDLEYDESFNKFSRGLASATPETSGTYSISCTRRDTFDFEAIDGTLRAGTTTRRIPLARPSRCRVYVRVSANTSTTFPDEARTTVVQATVTTARR